MTPVFHTACPLFLTREDASVLRVLRNSVLALRLAVLLKRGISLAVTARKGADPRKKALVNLSLSAGNPDVAD